MGGFDFVNICYRDLCETDGDCDDGEVCAWGGTEGVQKQCLRARCTRDADCTAHAGGRCVFVTHACFYNDGNEDERPLQLACAYPGGYCTDEADCDDDERCVVDDEGTRCATR